MQRYAAAMAQLVYVSEVDISVDNGRGVNEREFVRALLANKEADVTCVLPSPAHAEKFHSARIRYVRSHRQRKLLYGPYLVAVFRELLALRRERSIDALVVRLELTPLVPWAMSRLLGIPIILKTLTLYHLYWDEVSWWRTPNLAISRLFRPMYRAVVEEAVASDTVGPAFARWLRSTFQISEARLRVVRNGANLQLFSPGDRESSRQEVGLGRFRNLIGYVGELEEGRHLDWLIRGFARTVGAEEGTGLVLVGGGTGEKVFEEIARREGVADRVVFTGAVRYRTVPTYMRAFDVGIDLTVVRLKGHGRVIDASFSQKIAQYLACGLPVVAWATEDTAFLAEAGIGAVVPLEDEAQFARVLRGLVGLEEGARKAMARRAREFAEAHRSAQKITNERLAWWSQVARMETERRGRQALTGHYERL